MAVNNLIKWVLDFVSYFNFYKTKTKNLKNLPTFAYKFVKAKNNILLFF